MWCEIVWITSVPIIAAAHSETHRTHLAVVTTKLMTVQWCINEQSHTIILLSKLNDIHTLFSDNGTTIIPSQSIHSGANVPHCVDEFLVHKLLFDSAVGEINLLGILHRLVPSRGAAAHHQREFESSMQHMARKFVCRNYSTLKHLCAKTCAVECQSNTFTHIPSNTNDHYRTYCLRRTNPAALFPRRYYGLQCSLTENSITAKCTANILGRWAGSRWNECCA